MSWSYFPSDVGARSKVRRYIGDTNPSKRLVDDEVIDGELGGLETDAAVTRASAICARFALMAMIRDPDRSVEGLSVTRARIDAYAEVVKDLEAAAGLNGATLATMSAGNTSIADDAAVLEDADYEPLPQGYADEAIR